MFEGRAHADRGFYSREGTRSRQYSGKSSARHVCTGRRWFPQCRGSAGDGRAVTGVGERDSGHSHFGEWWPDAVCPGRCEEWLAFNAPVRRAGEQKGHLSFTSRGGLERGRDDSPCSRVGLLPSSEAETRDAVEGLNGSPRARRRSPRGSERVRMGRVLGFLESFPFFQI